MNIILPIVLGKPVNVWLGIATLLCFIYAAYIGWNVLKGNAKIEKHKMFVGLAFLVGLAHVVLALLTYF